MLPCQSVTLFVWRSQSSQKKAGIEPRGNHPIRHLSYHSCMGVPQSVGVGVTILGRDRDLHVLGNHFTRRFRGSASPRQL
jgi:hypothetical protein